MRRTPILGFLACLLFASCSSSIQYVHNTAQSQPHREVPFLQFQQNKGSSKIALILPDNPDSINIAQSAIADLLKDEGYNLIVVNKPGSSPQEIHSLDSREQRIGDIVSVFQQEIANQYDHFVLIGVGEGGYLIPYLNSYLDCDTSIAINIGTKSPLHDYSEWVVVDSLSPRQEQILFEKNIQNLDELKERITNLWSDEYGMDQLAPNTNKQWLSYAEAPFFEEVFAIKHPLFWINYDSYAMTSAAHRKEAALYSRHFLIDYVELQGSGNLNNEEQMQLLVEKLKEILPAR